MLPGELLARVGLTH